MQHDIESEVACDFFGGHNGARDRTGVLHEERKDYLDKDVANGDGVRRNRPSGLMTPVLP